jgi:hypothetical protein
MGHCAILQYWTSNTQIERSNTWEPTPKVDQTILCVK